MNGMQLIILPHHCDLEKIGGYSTLRKQNKASKVTPKKQESPKQEDAAMDEAKSTQTTSLAQDSREPDLAPPTATSAASAAVEGSTELQGKGKTPDSSSRNSKANTLESNAKQAKTNEESTRVPADAKRKGSRLQLAPASADERDPLKASNHVGAVWQPLDKATLGVTTKSKELESPSLATASAEVGVASECRVQPPVVENSTMPINPGAIAVQGININNESGVASMDGQDFGSQQSRLSESNSVLRSSSDRNQVQVESVEAHEQLNQNSRIPSINTSSSTTNLVTAELAIPVDQLVEEELISREQVLRRDIEHLVRKEVRESTVRAEAVALSRREPSRSRKMMIIGVSACMILLVLIIGAILGVSIAGNGVSDNKLRGDLAPVAPNYPTSSPTDGSTTPPALDLRYQLLSLLVEKHVTMSSIEALQDPQ